MCLTQWLRRIAPAVVVAALLLGVAPAQARDRDDRCAQRIHKAELQLERAIKNHGRDSRQADHHRRQLDRVRAQCNRGGKL